MLLFVNFQAQADILKSQGEFQDWNRVFCLD